MTDTQQPVALSLACELDLLVGLQDARYPNFGIIVTESAAQLRRLHAENENLHASCDGMREDRDRYFTLYGQACEVSARRLNEIAALEAQLSAIGAGGVESLRKRGQDDAAWVDRFFVCRHPAWPDPLQCSSAADAVRAARSPAVSDTSQVFIVRERVARTEFHGAEIEAVVAQPSRECLPQGAAPTRLEACDALLQTAHTFFASERANGMHGAVKWVQGDDGSLVIFTRGEYKDRLMKVIGSDEDVPHSFTPPPVPAAVAVPAEIDLPDVEDMAHSAVQEALSYGVNHDVFHRWMRAVMDKTVQALAAAPAQAQDDRAAFKAYLQECDDCEIVPDVAGAFHAAWQKRAAPAQAVAVPAGDLDSLQRQVESQASAWFAVCAALDNAVPGWIEKPSTGKECAVAAIEEMAAAAQEHATQLAGQGQEPSPRAAVTGPVEWPATCDGLEQEAWEAWARVQRFDMSEHPMHYLFLNERTDAARQGWKGGLVYAVEQMKQRVHVVEAAPAQEHKDEQA